MDGPAQITGTQSASTVHPKATYKDLFKKQWSQLTTDEKKEGTLDLGFKFVLSPITVISVISSLVSFLNQHLFGRENEFINRTAEISNRAAYFVNGIYGGVDNTLTNNIVGGVGYSMVSLASLFGNSENIYYAKAPGSATDQLPATNEELGYNEEIKKKYNIQPGEEKDFNKYKSYWDSVDKTFNGIIVVCKDIYKDFMSKKSKGILAALRDIFITDERKAEKNLVVSSLGLYASSILGIFPRLRKFGSVIRDLFGAHADLGLVAKAFSANKRGDEIGSNAKYGLCGGLYLAGSLTDLFYRLFGLDKLNILAVGLDNAGFWFMNMGNATDNRNARNSNKHSNE